MRLLPLVLAFACGGARSRDNSWLVGRDAVASAARELTANERALVDRNGFAILGAAEAPSFHVGYTALFHAHQPVYITADSLLYAWHSSYDTILMQLEGQQLIPLLRAMLDELREHLAMSTADVDTKADVDVYLAVAHSLLAGTASPPVAGGDASKIAALVDQATKAEGDSLAFLGDDDHFDWSMFKPRGHYAFDPTLSSYFRAMSWLGRAEMRIAQRKSSTEWRINRRALAASKLLATLFTPPTREKWEALDRTIGAFVGPPDSMSLPGLAAGLATLGSSTADADIVAAFHDRSAQRIRTQMLPPGDNDVAFVLLGQRFVFDSKVFSDVTYGNLHTKRMMPSPLDVAHAVFHNPVAQSLLATEVKTYGAEYANALGQARAASTAEPALWTGSLYHTWLLALRGLSPDPAQDGTLPAPLRSDAWGRRMLGTQLASWAELRHDNLLYAKESFTGEALCAYPAAYVDPYPTFYAAMAALAIQGRRTIEQLPAKSANQAKLLAYFDTMRSTMLRLGDLAKKERANQELTDDDLAWINHMVSINGRSGGCTTVRVPEGWYADLFYDRSKILDHEPIIADVHTQPTDEVGNPVGRVLHVGTGFPRMLVARIDHDGGAHRQTYRGFVATYAEVITEQFKRLDDESWRLEREKSPPQQPTWLQAIVAH